MYNMKYADGGGQFQIIVEIKLSLSLSYVAKLAQTKSFNAVFSQMNQMEAI